MSFGTIAMMSLTTTLPWKFIPEDTPKRESNANKIEDTSGNGTQTTGSSSGGSSNNYFKPGQGRVDDTRGTEVAKTGTAAKQPSSAVSTSNSESLFAEKEIMILWGVNMKVVYFNAPIKSVPSSTEQNPEIPKYLRDLHGL